MNKIIKLFIFLLCVIFMPLNVEASEKKVTISFVGDCTLGEYKGQGAGNQVKDFYLTNGADYFFNNVRDIFKNDDITVINLEGPFTNFKQTAVKKFPIKCEPEHVNILKNSSVEVCNLSNNHIFDCGEAGFNETKQILDENNIGYCGESNIYRINKNGINVSFLGYRGFNDTKELRALIKNEIHTEKCEGYDIVCVNIHWGIERENYSNKNQEDLAHYIIDSGADIVIGTHPHVLQGIEKYKGKTICYSLGNFCFGANKNPKDKDTIIFQQTFKIDDKNIISESSNIIPCRISSSTTMNNYQPTILTDDDMLNVLNRLKTYSSKY